MYAWKLAIIMFQWESPVGMDIKENTNIQVDFASLKSS